MNGLARDLRYALRQLAKHPGFAAVAILTLALGIGANAAIFSVVDATLLEPLPYAEPDRLALVYSQFPGLSFDKFWISAPEYVELRQWATAFSEIGAYATNTENVSGGSEPTRAQVGYVTASLLRTLGVPAARGRIFTDQEDLPAAAPVVLISDGLWNRLFAADPGVIGRMIEVDGVRREVVGVMPPGFDLADAGVEAWVPLALDPADLGGRGSHFLFLIGRLAPDFTLETARQQLGQLLERWDTEFPDDHHPNPRGHPLEIEPLHEDVVGDVRPAMMLLLGAVGLVLLIACANVANLLLARAEARQREIAVRSALGAGRLRLVRQLLTESVLLALIGGALGLGLAVAGVRALLAANPGAVPRAAGVGVDGRVLLFTLATALVAGILFGLVPAFHARSRGFFGALKGGRSTAGRGRQLFRTGLVAAEVTLATVLALGAGLLLRSFWGLLSVDPGFEPRRVLTLELSLPESGYPDGTPVAAFYERLLSRLEALPEIEVAAAMSGLPPRRSVNANSTEFEGLTEEDDGPPHNVDFYQVVSPRYFEAMGIELVAGRFFSASDAPGSPPVAIVNRALAETFWPGRQPVSQRLRRGWFDDEEVEEPWLTVVGVVEDVKQAGLEEEAGTELYLLHRQIPAYPPAAGMTSRSLHLALATRGEPLAALPAVRREVAALDPSLPVVGARPLIEVVSGSLARQRLMASLVGLFGLLALVLATVGTYGVLSYGVEQRRHEIGVRLALGAERGGILGLIVSGGMRPVVAGLALGALLAVGLRRVLASVLYGVSPHDPLTFATVGALLAGVALAACLLPGRRASRVDPLTALRYE